MVARVGLLTERYRHGIEVGVSDSREGTLLDDRESLALGLTSERFLWNLRGFGLLSASAEIGYQARLAFTAAPGQPRVIHGPRIGIRPIVFTAPGPGLLEIGHRFGSVGFLELFFTFWMSAGGGHDGTIGVALTWDTPVPH